MKTLTDANAETRSPDPISANLEQLKQLFPDAVTDGKVDVDILAQLLGASYDESEEKYGLNWNGKRRARQAALVPSNGTLRPLPEDSVDWDTTRNIVIEGDNLEVLKLLQKSYAAKVKLIYIDPPYNTGGDFVYPDDFKDNIKNYLMLTGQIDSDGRKLSSNSDASGRFHTSWLNMMYPRLRLARNLLRPDGLIFVSIDDNEVGALRLVLSEIFGEENFEGHIHWRRRHNQPNDPTKMLALVAEHVLCYAKDKAAYKAAGVGKIALTGDFSNPDNDARGDWASKPWKVGSDQSGSRYKITTPTGRVYDEEWMGELSTFEALRADKRIIFPDKGNGAPRKKYFRSEREEEGQCATNWWPHDQFGHNQAANGQLEQLLGQKNVFSNPKPVELIGGIIDVSNTRNSDIVLDFFAGSGTTAHAAMERNRADGGNRRFILIQLPEPLDPTNNDQKVAAGYCDKLKKPRLISELTKERLRRAAKSLRKGQPVGNTDYGFRVFKLASSNIHAWEPDRDNLAQTLQASAEHLKADRTDQDVLFELLLKLGLDLTVPIEQRTIAGTIVYSVGVGVLFVCLASSIKAADAESLALGIISWHKQVAPAGETNVVFRDSAFESDVAKTNLTAILQQHGLENVRSI